VAAQIQHSIELTLRASPISKTHKRTGCFWRIVASLVRRNSLPD